MALATVVHPALAPSRRILAVSDIHGNRAFFRGLLEKAAFSSRDILVLVGDILEKGPDSLGLLRDILELSQDHTILPVCGNCDGLVLRFFEDDLWDQGFFRVYLPAHPESILRQMAREAGFDRWDDLPRLREWFVESTLYPFVGGNTIRRPASPVPGLLPGINHILPYASPSFRGECSEEAVFQLSRVCLESARDVISVLEQEYRALYGRNLTLSRLPEAIILPLCPDKGTCLNYDPTLAASVYLENDLEQLMRTHS